MNEFKKIPFDEYLSLPYMSVHGLKLFSEDPISYLLSFQNIDNASTPAKDEGKGFHARILTPELYLSEFAKAPDVPKRSEKDKAYWKEFEAHNNGKTILPIDTVQEIEFMAASVSANPRACELLSGGQAEMSGIWYDDRGFWCKIRPDYLKIDEYSGIADISDLKTVAGDIGGPIFTKEISNRLYHWQDYYYRKGTHMILNLERVNFHLIAVSKKWPYRCRVFTVSDEDIGIIGKRIEGILSNFGVYMEADIERWFSDNEEQNLNLPPWAL